VSEPARLEGFDRVAEGLFCGRGLPYTISRSGLADDRERYLWTVTAPGGEVIELDVEGLDQAIRCATAHALAR
jgi:hypothetical protein